MRLYFKLALFMVLFAGLTSAAGRRMTVNLAYEVRVFMVWHVGTSASFEDLLRDTDRMLGAERAQALQERHSRRS